ncbi:unnamed protein product [Paramecium pentaurelia]|uniref:Tetratricopeptide repeat protein n=1 Tax=Paramecium pentaurelia TaxID=43138 RepID=A0A8S1V0I7_9CILI|nr:unnamed protein product [Paramecium pentaurelia]
MGQDRGMQILQQLSRLQGRNIYPQLQVINKWQLNQLVLSGRSIKSSIRSTRRKRKTLQDYNISIKLNLNYADVYNNRGVLQNGLGDKQKALQDHTIAIKLNQNYAPAYYTQVIIQLYTQEFYLKNKEKIKSPSKNQLYKGIAQMILHVLILEIKPINIYINQNIQTNQFHINKPLYEQKFNDLENQIIKLSDENSDMKMKINSILEQDYFQVSETLKQLNKKENINQFMYFNALVWTLFPRIYFKLIKMQQQNVIQNNAKLFFQKVVNAGLSTLGALPGGRNTFNLINTALDYGFEYRKNKNLLKDQQTEQYFQMQFYTSCSIINKDINCKPELSKSFLSNLTDKPESNFKFFVDQLLTEEDKQFRDSEYWAASTGDASIILNYMKKNSERMANQILNKQVILK